MKIEIEIPDWAEEKHIYVMAGIEMVAYKKVGEKWHVKVRRCAKCGKCCQGCEHLKHKECSLGIKRPFLCCITNGKEYCQEQYKVL